MVGLVRRFVDDDTGAETVEYALVLALSLWRKVPPFAIVLGGAFAGVVVGLLPTGGLGV
jgi:hypothetical protein